MIKIVRDIWHIPELRRRIVVTLSLLVVYRLGFYIYLPGIDIVAFTEQQREGGGGLLDFLLYTRALTGGSFTPFLFSLGIMPYISASIIFSLMIKVFPRLEALSKEGEQGRRQINRYTRYATVLLCVVQSLFLVSAWSSDPSGSGRTVTANPTFFIQLLQVLCLTVGSVFLMWLGEKITEFGIGNGTSLIIMAGIVARMPAAFATLGKKIILAEPEQMPFEVVTALTFLMLYVGVVAAVVFITKGQRRIPIQQQRSVKGRRVYGGQRQYMPIKVLAAGVLPIIFAQSLMVIPSGIMSYFAYGGAETLLYRILGALASAFSYGGFLYIVLYIALIFFFTYFWTGLMFNPVEIANNMKEYGSFIPGIRPGKRTAEYLERVLKRITLAGASFLTCVALVPQMVSRAMDIDIFVSTFLGGTGILIVVGVALDLDDKIEAQLLVRQYEGFVRGGDSGGTGVRQKKPTL